MCLLQTVLSASAAEKKWCRWKVERKSDFAVMPVGINGGMHILIRYSEKPSIYINVRTAVRSLKYMATATESIAATSVMWSIGSEDKQEFRNEKLYQTTMLMARKMLFEGIISDKEYGQIDTIFREKYHPTLGTLFADISLTSGAKRVMYSSGRK
jgi:hypothetical protein